MPALNYVPYCVHASQTASCAESSVRQPSADQERPSYQSPPFTNTGFDYFVPLCVIIRGTTKKGSSVYLFKYSCSSCKSRSVHGHVLQFNESRAVRLPAKYACYGLLRQWYTLHRSGERAP